MNTRSEEQVADEVLRRILIEVRAARTRRRAVKGTLAGLMGLMAVTLGVVLSQRPASFAAKEPELVETVRPLPPGKDEAIAVMVWKDGAARLEWIQLRDLGTVELQFNLEPVFAFADEG